ncbi:uncharacterized protein B0H18DRAFT_1036276 [Fomitopsis serialis]|uniref:uncharacterized protein n=1 Tax=Fomitopsis serialis TaxID=139415 RepID=UPI002008781D|nr:uncharacterized protein B0H18DRAFT_1036276 [Neoantrodia serialis]KAH9917023.1 hypothetical protein B0H18DRAFT_1036276 [Neoantrodia serialis]
MARVTLPLLTAISGLIPLVAGHAAFFHPSMWGFNVTMQTFPYDNRPVAPLTEYTFDQWWFHGHLDYPPNDGDIFELPAGQPVTTQVACDKGATTFFASDPGGNIQNGDDPCPGSPPSEYHTTGFDDLKGCALAITYKSNVSDVQPEDFTVFSVNQTCVWYRFTDFQVPARMPACPAGGCICAWMWIHSPDSGGEQNYMNGFRCNVTGATSDVALAQPQVPRRCGSDPDNDRPEANFGNCTWGAKQPFYWLQQERNNMFEGYYSPPFYTNLYNFLDGAQQDIFEDSYPGGLPTPVVNGTIPVANFAGVQPTATPSAPSGLPMAIVGTPAPAATGTSGSGSGGGTTTSDVNLASPTASSSSGSSSSPTGLTCAKGGGQAILGKRRLTRRSTESGLQDFWEAMKPGPRRRDISPDDSDLDDQSQLDGGRDYRPAQRSRLWRIF